MKNLQIKIVEKYVVDNRHFPSLEEAQKYIDREKSSINNIAKNLKLLEDFKKQEESNWIPVKWKDTDGGTFFDFLFVDGDGNSGTHWTGIFHCDSLRYLDVALEIVEWNYVWPLLQESLESFPHMEVSDLPNFISAMTQNKMVFSAVANKHPQQIYDLFAKIQFTPVYIYE